MLIRIFLVAFLAVQVLNQVTPPVWPEVFHQSFVESYNFTHMRTTGRFSYDSKRDAMRIDRQDGIHDPVCGSLLPNVSTPCSHLIRDKKRYIVMPERRACCMCCDAAHGCGTLKRDWLSTAKYLGQQTLSGQAFYKWSIPDGDMIDLFYSTKTEQRVPRRFTQGPRTTVDYIMNTYSTDPIPDSVFTLPDYCKTTCPATTVCGKFQLQQLIDQ